MNDLSYPEPYFETMKTYLLAAMFFAFVNTSFAQTDSTKEISLYKPRIITTTDLGADPDDEQSMIRLLVCASEFEIEGLIVSTGCWKKTQTDTKMLDKLVDVYAEVFPNLSVHAEDFPTPDYLRSISVMGQKGYGMDDVGEGKNSQGSDLIIAAVDKDDPRPVWLAVGVVRTLSRKRFGKSAQRVRKMSLPSSYRNYVCLIFSGKTTREHGSPKTSLSLSISGQQAFTAGHHQMNTWTSTSKVTVC